MSAQIVLMPIIRREPRTLDFWEQADREFMARRQDRVIRPHRTRPLLVIDNKREAADRARRC